MKDAEIHCLEENRREDVRAADLFGLDCVEVSDDERTLSVYFLGKAPKQIDKSNLRLSGGRRVRDVKIVSVKVQRHKDPTQDDILEVRVDKPGDFSTYTLSVVNAVNGRAGDEPMDGFDRRYSKVSFTFKAGCPSDLDCKPVCGCPPPAHKQPEINYLGKDYGSFRQLILDRLALIMPGWQERHVPDLGIALVELLAYAGDYLSYYQDAVATEAYIGTARQRISVRRHARLVDYLLHDGCNARAWVTIATDTDRELGFDEIYFITAFPGAPEKRLLAPGDLVDVAPSSYEVFEPLWSNDGGKIALWQAHNKIHFYTWGDCECCLAPGATSATLMDDWIGTPHEDPYERKNDKKPPTPYTASRPREGEYGKEPPPDYPTDEEPAEPPRALRLKVGDMLIFEERLGPKTGNPADADPTHRQAVRLTKVTPGVDPLYHTEKFPDLPRPVVEIEWAEEDALTFTLCISSRAPYPDCDCMENVSVARGNVVLVDNGAGTSEELGTVPTESAMPQCPTHCAPSEMQIMAGQFRLALKQLPLTFSEPLPPPCSAAELIAQEARQALPWMTLQSIPAGVCDAIQPASAEDGVVSEPQPCIVPPLFAFSDIADPTALAHSLMDRAKPKTQLLHSRLGADTRTLLANYDGSGSLPQNLNAALIRDLKGLLEAWTPRRDMLESRPDDRHFVVEMDNDGHAHLRFGDGELGRRPEAGMAFRAEYRLGNGREGNVGAESIIYIVARALSGITLAPRNPMAAMGGTDPEPMEEAKLFAPHGFRSVLERAITAEDCASIAQDNARRRQIRAQLAALDPEICTASFRKLQRAKAVLRWTGSWYAMQVAIDPAEAGEADRPLIDEIAGYLEPFRRMGHDLVVEAARYVPLSVRLLVCVLPDYLRGHVKAALLDALGSRALPDGRLGFFHPDNLSFGEGIYVSRLVAAAQAVAGVQDVRVMELERFDASEPQALTDSPEKELPLGSVLALGPLEIARLDNDPNFPENGRLVIDVRGGR
jgi:hypothetical protein